MAFVAGVNKLPPPRPELLLLHNNWELKIAIGYLKKHILGFNKIQRLAYCLALRSETSWKKIIPFA
jgi:hypothetical protein